MPDPSKRPARVYLCVGFQNPHKGRRVYRSFPAGAQLCTHADPGFLSHVVRLWLHVGGFRSVAGPLGIPGFLFVSRGYKAGVAIREFGLG